MTHQQAFLRFKELLESRRAAHDPDRDIREHVLELTEKTVGIGYVSGTLEKSFGANLPNLFNEPIAVDRPEFPRAGAYFAPGTIFNDEKTSHKGAVRLFTTAPLDKEIIFFESAFLATTHSWAHSFQQGDPAQACLGYVFDDLGHYFMADYPNRLIRKLNSDETPTAEELARAERLIERLVARRISKYNAQPLTAPEMTEGRPRRVLVCDQAYADASTIYGRVGDAEFERMLLAAITENPDAEILVKTHPDSVWSKADRSGYFAHLRSTGRVRLLRDPVNPYALFELVDTVYVGTSQMGLEALFAGKKVVAFGAPFYGGWGLTDDRQTIPHRSRARSLAELFHYFYIWYTIYTRPDREGPVEIEDVIDYIEANRPYTLPPRAEDLAEPRVSVVIPVHGVEKYIEECIASIQRQTLVDIEIIPVNDASPDEAQRVVDRLAAADPRIRPILLPRNEGQGVARNRGLEAARGDYVWLLDGDDWLPNAAMLERLVELAERDALDMVRAPKAYEAVFDQDDEPLSRRRDATEDYFREIVRRTDFAGAPEILHNRHCWTWLYRRGFLEEHGIRFVTPQWEERAFLLKALVRAKGIGLSDVEGPAYRIRMNSTARRDRGPRDFEMMLTNFRSTFDWLLEAGAGERGHPLRPHLEFQLSQFVQHMAILGPYAHYRGAGEADELAFVDKLAAELHRCGFQPADFVTRMHRLSERHVRSDAFPLITAAILARRLDLLRAAVDVAPIPQDKLYPLLLSTEIDPGLQAAINRYARNERAAPPTVEPEARATPGARPRIVFHIGATKTGSTFLQHMLELNRPALLREGVWFPEVGLFWQPTRPRKQAGHADFTRAAVREDPSLREHIRRGLALMEGRIHTIVLSSEAFFLQENAPRLADYFAGHPMEMVVYLRRQDEWANSQYCEFVAGGAVGRVDVSVEDWLDQPSTRRRLNYLQQLRRWAEKIRRANVHARVYDRDALVEGDILSDFAEAARLPELLTLPRPSESEQNEAMLSAAHVEVMRLFNKLPFAGRDAYFEFVEEVAAEVARWRRDRGLPMQKPWVIPQDRADAIMAGLEDANGRIARNFLNRPDGTLFAPRTPIPEQSIPIHPEEIALIGRIYERHAAPETPAQTPAAKPAGKDKPGPGGGGPGAAKAKGGPGKAKGGAGKAKGGAGKAKGGAGRAGPGPGKKHRPGVAGSGGGGKRGPRAAEGERPGPKAEGGPGKAAGSGSRPRSRPGLLAGLRRALRLP